MKYPTLKTLCKELNAATESLKGKCPIKEKHGISGLVEDAIKSIIESEKYSNCLLEINYCQLSTYSTILKRNLIIGEFKPIYRIDKRKLDGRSNYLEKVDFVLEKSLRDLMELEVVNLSQKLTYDYAKENHDRLVREVEEFQKEIAERMEGIKKYEDIMRSEKYE